MDGILGWGGYLPHGRLDRTTIRAVAGTGGGPGTRTVASYDEDTTTMAVAAARLALATLPGTDPGRRQGGTEPGLPGGGAPGPSGGGAPGPSGGGDPGPSGGGAPSPSGGTEPGLPGGGAPGPSGGGDPGPSGGGAPSPSVGGGPGLHGGGEPGRPAGTAAGGSGPRALWFATADPVYLDKSNAAVVHAALRLDRTVAAYDAVGSVRSAMGALRAGLAGDGPALVVASDVRTGLPGGPDESAGGDGAAALLVGSDRDGPVLAELVGWTSLTEEFLDRWREPGAPASRTWEERFGETRYTALGSEALKLALGDAGLDAGDVDALVVAGLHARAARAVAGRSGVPADRIADRLDGTVGNTGAAQPAMLLAAALERAEPGRTIVLLALADGADAVVLRTTAALADHVPARPLARQIAEGAAVGYGTYLAWRGLLPVEPPRRPEPARPSASAAARNRDWKFGFVGSEGADGTVRLPPSPLDDAQRPMADETGVVAALTVDRLAYSPSPPVIFAVVDFEGGGRLPVELTDVREGEVAVGDRVEMTFRRPFTADGVRNYFWKGRPVPAEGSA